MRKKATISSSHSYADLSLEGVLFYTLGSLSSDDDDVKWPVLQLCGRHEHRPLLHSFVFMLIRPTALVLKQIFFWNLLVVARLVGLISIKTKEYFIWPPLWKRSIWWQMFNFVLLSQMRWFQLNSRIVLTHFARVMTLNNGEIIAETRSYIFRWRFRSHRRRLCLSSLLSLNPQ